MQTKLNKTENKKNNQIAGFKNIIKNYWRVFVYAICGLGLCWIDLWRGIGNGAQWALAVNCTGFCIAPFIVFRFDWRGLILSKTDTIKWHVYFRACFYLWLIIFSVLSYPVFLYFAPGTDYDAQIITAIANVGIYGCIAIRAFFFLFHERKFQSNEYNYKITCIFFVWLLFMVFAVFSVNEAVWPIWFLVMFGSFYIAPLRKGELNEIIEGLVNGMLIGFFWIQSRAFLYRPYDLSPRYRGHYTNENVNAMFYMTTYIAWLVKMSMVRLKKQPYRYAFSLFFASSMWSFVFLTGCRSVMLGMIGVSLTYFFFESKSIGKNIFLQMSIRMVTMFAFAMLSFVPVFMCARYIPSLRHHPIWYGGEYCEESVMSWDPIDSPKYMELEDVLETGLGRFNPFH